MERILIIDGWKKILKITKLGHSAEDPNRKINIEIYNTNGLNQIQLDVKSAKQLKEFLEENYEY